MKSSKLLISPEWLQVCVVYLLLAVVYACIFHGYADKYLTGGNDLKFDISSEIFKRILFKGDIEQIDQYCVSLYGTDYNILTQKYATAISDERPLYFLYLALLKSFAVFPTPLYFTINIFLIFVSLGLLATVLELRSKPLFILLCGIFMAPFTIFYAIIYEPHILQIFFTCLGLCCYQKQKWFWSFFFLALTIFVHGANIVLVAAIGLYHLFSNYRTPKAISHAFLGGLAGWLLMECVLFILFQKDVHAILPHQYLLERLLFHSDRMQGGFSKSAGVFQYLKTSVGFLPLATIGLFWIKSKFQFSVTLLPILMFFIISKFNLPGALRVFLPIYFMGFVFFFSNTMTLSNPFFKSILISFMLIALANSLCYYAYVYQCASLKQTPSAAVDPDLHFVSSSCRKELLLWNLKRRHVFQKNAPVLYTFTKSPISIPPNIPSPSLFYTYAVRKIISKFTGTAPNQLPGFSGTAYGFQLIKSTQTSGNSGKQE